MNVRKSIDYSAMFAALDTLMASDMPQMKLYCEIGRLVSGRLEKGAAVAAAEYLCGTYPDVSGFSPRNLRRMREFYRAYESAPEVLAQAIHPWFRTKDSVRPGGKEQRLLYSGRLQRGEGSTVKLQRSGWRPGSGFQKRSENARPYSCMAQPDAVMVLYKEL